MKAQPGRIYAQILADRVQQVFSAEQLPEWHDGLTVLDVTSVEPAPAPGDYYSGGQFFHDPGPAPDEYHALDRATFTWRPMDLAAADALKAARAAGDIDTKVMRTVFEVLFSVVNDVRVLKGQQAITRAQLRDQMVAFYKSL